jgi:hypothetical protein
MTFWVKTGGLWGSSPTTKIWVKTGGVWVEVQNAYVKDGGVWQLFHSAASPVAFSITSIGDTEASPTTATASLTLNSNGTITTTGNTSSAGSNWYTPTTGGIGSSYWAMLTVNSGTAPTSGTAGSVLFLNGGETWTWTRSTNGTTTANCTLTI